MNVLYNKFIKALKNPELIILLILNNKYIGTLFSDELFLKLKYRLIMKKKLILKNPQTFNEKLQWLKLHDRKPKYTMMVDKYEVRKYIAQKLGEEYLIPLLGVWDNVDDIDFDALPNQFVLKCNHNSGLGMCICKDKSKLDIEKVKKELKKGLKQDYYMTGREWSYKNVPRKIICEKYMEDSKQLDLIDYKFYCFNGTAKFLYMSQGLGNIDHSKARVSYVTMDYKPMAIYRNDYKAFGVLPPKPEKFNEMVKLAEEISRNIPFLRVDLYYINKKIYFSEATFYPGAGFTKYTPEEWDDALGSWINLQNEENK